jgi:hypothetical protein
MCRGDEEQREVQERKDGQDDLAVQTGGEEQHPCGEAVTLYGGQHPAALQAGHPHVVDRHVGSKRRDQLERLAARRHLADQLELGTLLDGAHDPFAIDGLVIGDHNADSLFTTRAHARNRR